jgi:hypothetical protein
VLLIEEEACNVACRSCCFAVLDQVKGRCAGQDVSVYFDVKKITSSCCVPADRKMAKMRRGPYVCSNGTARMTSANMFEKRWLKEPCMQMELNSRHQSPAAMDGWYLQGTGSTSSSCGYKHTCS